MRVLLILPVLLAKSLAVFRLSDISITDGIVQLPVEKGGILYVAANDDDSILGKIKITNNFETKTASELARFGTKLDQTSAGWEINGNVTISSTNTEMEALHLTGFVYCTTHSQAQDSSFLVYSVDRSIVISHNLDDLTAVFLNQNLGNTRIPPAYVPQKSSHISNFGTFAASAISIYWDEPTESYKNSSSDDAKQKLIFSNPLAADTLRFFDCVEPFQIFNDVWFLRSKGQIRFQVEPKWEDPNGTTTTKVTTTGLLMSSGKPENLTIRMKSNEANEATTGLNILYNVQNPIKLEMSGWGIGVDTMANEKINNHRAAWSPSLSTYFQISSLGDQGGRYAAQYWQTEGVPLPSTTPRPSTSSSSTTAQGFLSTTTTVPTTTRTASKMSYFWILIGFLKYAFFTKHM